MSNQHNQYFEMAIAYIEIGRIASKKNWINEKLHKVLCVGRVSIFSDESNYKNAVAYQLFHAVELFLKFAILVKTGNTKKIHKLNKLSEEYESLYPEPEFRFEHPFDFSDYHPCDLNPNEYQLYVNHINQFKPEILDQHLRYPIDEKTGGYSFSLDTLYFVKMRKEFHRLYSKICPTQEA